MLYLTENEKPRFDTQKFTHVIAGYHYDHATTGTLLDQLILVST